MKISSVDLKDIINVGTGSYNKAASTSNKGFDSVLSKSISKSDNKSVSNSKRNESDDREATVDKQNPEIEDTVYDKQQGINNDKSNIDSTNTSDNLEVADKKSEEDPDANEMTDNNSTNDLSANLTNLEALLMKLFSDKSLNINDVNRNILVEGSSDSIKSVDLKDMRSLLKLISSVVSEKEANKLIHTLTANKDSKTSSEILNLLSKNDGTTNSEELNSLLSPISNSQSGESQTLNSQLDNAGTTLANDIAKIASLIGKVSANDKIKQEKVLEEANTSMLVAKEGADKGIVSASENAMKDAFTKQESTSQNENSILSQAEDKEDKLLKSIIGSDNKAENKVIAFQAQLNRLRDTAGTVDKVSLPSAVNSTNMASDVVKAIKYMNVNNLKELTIKVNPQELGEMTIKISMEGSILKASISASNKDTYNMLNSNVTDIKNSLNNSQIKIQDVAINIYNDDTTFFSNSFDRNGQSSNEQNRRSSGSNRTIEVDDLNNTQSVETTENSDNNLSVLA